MQPIVRDWVAWSGGLSFDLSFCLLRLWALKKMVELIVLDVDVAWVGLRNHVLDGVQMVPMEGTIWGGERTVYCKVYGLLYVCCRDAAFYLITLTTCWCDAVKQKKDCWYGSALHRCQPNVGPADRQAASVHRASIRTVPTSQTAASWTQWRISGRSSLMSLPTTRTDTSSASVCWEGALDWSARTRSMRTFSASSTPSALRRIGK